MTGYTSLGKQVLLGRDHIADAVDPATAERIADALNLWDSGQLADGSQITRIIDTSDMSASAATVASIAEELNGGTRIPGVRHAVRQENDEYACSCGARWDVHEGEEHP
jgi:hypothetical protein